MALTYSDIERVANCTFQPRNGGHWQRCRDRATWVDDGTNRYNTIRRCDRHKALDARTSANYRQRHGWDGPYTLDLFPFDAPAAIADAQRAKEAKDAVEVSRKRHESGVEALRRVIHVAEDLGLTPNEVIAVTRILNARIKD